MAFDLGLILTFSLCVWVMIDLLTAGGAWERRLPFAAVAATSAVWVLGEFVWRRATTLDELMVARRVLHLGVGLLPVAWLGAAAVVGRAGWVRRAPWLVLVPLASAAVTYSFLYWDTGGRFISGPKEAQQRGPVFWYSATVGWSLIVIGTVYLLSAASRFDRSRPLRIAGVALGSTVPLVGNMLYIGGASGQVDPTPLLIGLSVVVLRLSVVDTGLSGMLHRASGVFERLKTGVLLADLEGRVVDANPTARSLAGDIQPRGTPLDEVVARALARPDKVIDVEKVELRRALGDVGHAVLLTDRTEAVRMEERLREAQRHESLALLAAGVGHDFNNMLLTIRSSAERAGWQLAPEHPALAHLEELREGVRAARALADQLLGYAGKPTGTRRLLDLRSELEGLQVLANLAAQDRARLEFELAEELPPIEADPVEIQQILVNLVTNAAEACGESGHIRVRTVAGRLALPDLERFRPGHEAEPGEHVLIEVADDGCGMDAATLERIFEPFFTTRPEGHGLGLAVLMGIVHSYGGALHVVSTPGAGTTFRIYLPAAAPG